jgi:serine/threonine-protein kinase
MATTGEPVQGPCPDREELRAFLWGALPPSDRERLAAHRHACPQCAQTLESLEAEMTAHPPASRETVRQERQDENDPDPDPVVPDASPRSTLPGRSLPPAAATEWQGPRTFGNYDLLEKIGQGAMSIVFKARQRTLHRVVALKMLLAGRQADHEALTRFCIEGEAVARLHHPNVVEIYELGEHEGQLYLAMEFLEGGSLADRIAAGPLSEQEAAPLVLALARAIHAAHEAGILHRDLKPANVLLGADGTPKVADFGLAKLRDDPHGANTHTDAILGTAAYMAPCQARGATREVSPATDVWALGVILYEALTGQTPFRGCSGMETLLLVRRAEPRPPRFLRPGLSRELEAVCLHCLQKDPRHRYASAAALADDLENWLQGRGTAARPLGRIGNALRALRRHPRRLAGAAAILGGVVLALMAWLWLDPERPRRQSEAALGRGQTVVLVGDTGGPRWSRWRSGQETSALHASPAGPLTLHSLTEGLLELVPDPRLEHYWLRARVRHAQTPGARVGLYFAHRLYPTSVGDVHFFGALAFEGLPAAEPRRGPASAELQPHLLWSVGRGSDLSYRCGGLSLRPLPSPAGGDGWHDLAVEVSPEGVRGFCDGRDVGLLPAAAFAGRAREMLRGQAGNTAAATLVRELSLDFAPRGSLGLYVDRGSASFCNVLLKPVGRSD